MGEGRDLSALPCQLESPCLFDFVQRKGVRDELVDEVTCAADDVEHAGGVPQVQIKAAVEGDALLDQVLVDVEGQLT